jgi:hypothetical protein
VEGLEPPPCGLGDHYSPKLSYTPTLIVYIITNFDKINQYPWGEYALNADEIVNITQTEGIAYGDCEEFAVLLAIMYLGASYRSAIVIFVRKRRRRRARSR